MSESDLRARLDRLEAEAEIRRVTARYFRICDDLGPHTDMDELGGLFAADAVWLGKGRYEGAFGGYRGRAAIVAMLDSYCRPEPHFAMTAHFFSAEDIAVEGTRATGRWMMLQCSTYRDGSSDLRSAALTIGFTVEEGRWRISDFQTRNLFSRRVDHWSDVAAIPVPELQGTAQ